MSTLNHPTLIHWHEGLFLQPHHLQSFQRSMLHHIWGGPRLHLPFAYGVVEAQFSLDELAEGRLRFDPLHVVLPSGTVFRFPKDAELLPLDIKQAFDKLCLSSTGSGRTPFPSGKQRTAQRRTCATVRTRRM